MAQIVNFIRTRQSDHRALAAMLLSVFPTLIGPHKDHFYSVELSDGAAVEFACRAGLSAEIGSDASDSSEIRTAFFRLMDQFDLAVVCEGDDEAFVASGAARQALEAQALGLQDITVVSSAEAFGDALWGPLPAHPAVTPDLQAWLLAHGFETKRKPRGKVVPAVMARALFADYVLELDSYDDKAGWDAVGDFGMSIACKRFAAVMEAGAAEDSGPLAALGARKMRKDKEGVLFWSGGLYFRGPALPETGVRATNVGDLSFADLAEQASALADPVQLLEAAIGGPLKHYIITSEGHWVVLFLAADAGLSVEQTFALYLRFLSQDPIWGDQGALTQDIIEAYFARHSDVLGGA